MLTVQSEERVTSRETPNNFAKIWYGIVYHYPIYGAVLSLVGLIYYIYVQIILSRSSPRAAGIAGRVGLEPAQTRTWIHINKIVFN